MKKPKRIAYTDLENEYIKNKFKISKLEQIEKLVKEYPNNEKLGDVVRKLILNK
jgi:hypothetical protein